MPTFYNDNVLNLSELLATRHEEYTTFTIAMHDILLRTYRASQNLKEQPPFQAITPELQQGTHVHHHPPSHCTSCKDYHIQYKIDHELLQRYYKQSPPMAGGFHQLFASVIVHLKPELGHAGSTWIEL